MRCIAALLLLFGTYGAVLGDKTPIEIRAAKFPSPDGKIVASFEYNDDGWVHLDITNSISGHQLGSAKVELTPIFSLEWTSDSKSIVIVSHIAHGSTATIFHCFSGNWKDFIVFPPERKPPPDLYRIIYDVTKTEVREHDIIVTYDTTIQFRSDSGDFAAKEYLVSLLINPATNKVLTLDKKPVN